MVFFSTYKLYKQGTSQVVAWLGRTAAQFVYELGSANTLKQEKESATAKREKNTKKQGSKTNRKSSGNADSKATSHTIPIRELPVLARVISEHVQKLGDVKPVTSILKVLKDVIVKRKQWAGAFGQPVASILESDVRHQHFVSVLEDVYRILEDVASTLNPELKQTRTVAGRDGEPSGRNGEFNGRDGESRSAEMDEIALSNLFYVLDIEEPEDQKETGGQKESLSRPIRNSSSPAPFTPTYELEDEITDEEVYFMIYCFFEDFQEVRRHVGQSWSDYKNGSIDLVAVAVTTNVALEMLQRAETALIASLPERYHMTNFERVGIYLQLVVAHARGVDPSFHHEREDVINMDLQDITDFICLPVYMILSSFTRVIQGDHVPVLRPGHFGELDMTGEELSWKDKFQQDKIALCEILPDFCIFKQVKQKIAVPAVDKLTLGLMDMMSTKKIPIWLVLGCQVYLDIHHTMLSSIGMAHRELQAMGLHVSKTLDSYFEFSKGMSIENWGEQNDKVLRMIKLEADVWVNQDFFAATQKKLFQSVKLPESLVRPYSVLSRHPLLCGVLLFRLNLRLQEAGVVLVSAWGSLPSVMHLYNAVRQEFSANECSVWEDVENVIQLQGKERVFVGEYPKSRTEYLKRFCLVMGHSASMFALNRREGQHQHTLRTQTSASSRGPREMVTTSAIADVFRGQYCENETRSEVTFHKLEKLLSTSLLGKTFGAGGKNKPRQFTSSSFLSALQAHIQADFLALNMDYFALHMRCFELLRNIHVKLDPEFRKYVGPDYLEKENQLPFLVGYLFVIAVKSGSAAESLRLAGPGRVVQSMTLIKAMDLVKELVQKEGSMEIERVRKITRWSELTTTEDE